MLTLLQVLLPIFAVTTFAEPQRAAAMHDKVPELVGGPWVNTPGNKPISLAARKGKVTIVEF